MSTLFNHAMRHEWTDRNPITLVRQSAKRQRTPDVLDVQEVQSLLAELAEPGRTAVFLAASTGLRVSELLALKWGDIDFSAGEINLSRGIFNQHVGTLKTEMSKKPLALSPALADVLLRWKNLTPYSQATDWVFASPHRRGRQPYWAGALLQKVIHPAAVRAGITKRIGWHTFRHSFATLLKSNGEDVKTVQESLRHANSRVSLDVYTQAVTPAKREAQSKIALMFLCVPTEQGDRLVSA